MTAQQENTVFERHISHYARISFRSLCLILMSRWYWIIGTSLAALLLSYIYLKTAAPKFEGSVTLRFQDKQSELDDLKGKGPALILGRTPKDYLAEKYNVNSPELIEKTLELIDTPFTFRRIKDFRKIDVYPFRPAIFSVLFFEENLYENGTFEIDEKLALHYETDSSRSAFQMKPGSVIVVPGLHFRIDSLITAAGFQYEFTFEPHRQKALSLSGKISLTEVEDPLPIMTLSFRSQNEAFTEGFLTNLLETYKTYSLLRKQISTDLTIQFIGQQKRVFSDSLRHTAQQLEAFKTRNQVHDLSISSADLTAKLRELELEQHKLEVQKGFIALLENKLSAATQSHLEYLSLGLDASSDAVLLKLIEQLNQKITERKELSVHLNDDFPFVRTLDQELRKLQAQIAGNLRLQKQKNEHSMRVLDITREAIRSQYGRIPDLEKNMLYLQSRFEVNRAIYALLLNKEVEASLLRAGILPAFTVLTPVEIRQLFPKQEQVLLISIVAGLMTGAWLIFLKRHLNRSFNSFENLDPHPKTILSGIIQRAGKDASRAEKDLPALNRDKNSFTESVNALRTKVIFSKSNLKETGRGKVLMVTSEQSGEGKSFVTINLALSLARINKNVLVICCDLRKPVLDQHFGHTGTGLSEWLGEKKTGFEGLICASVIEQLHYIPGGQTPPLPGEILQQEKFMSLIGHARSRYDYILLDTAPVGLVADNVPHLMLADHILFVVRWLYSNAGSQQLAIRLATEYHLEQIMIVVNDFHVDHLYERLTAQTYPKDTGYGYYYQDPGRARAYFHNPENGLWDRVKHFFSHKR